MPPLAEKAPETFDFAPSQRMLATMGDMDAINQRFSGSNEQVLAALRAIQDRLDNMNNLSEADVKRIAKSVVPKQEKVDVKEETGTSIVEKINDSKGKIDFEKIKNFPWEAIQDIVRRITPKSGGDLVSWGGSRLLTATGTVDDSNTEFQFNGKPILVYINGVAYQQTGGAYTWTYAEGLVTLSNAVGTGGTIWGLQ